MKKEIRVVRLRPIYHFLATLKNVIYSRSSLEMDLEIMQYYSKVMHHNALTEELAIQTLSDIDLILDESSEQFEKYLKHLFALFRKKEPQIFNEYIIIARHMYIIEDDIPELMYLQYILRRVSREVGIKVAFIPKKIKTRELEGDIRVKSGSSIQRKSNRNCENVKLYKEKSNISNENVEF